MAVPDVSVDLAIVGSGGGGLVAALVAVDLGLEPLVLEKQEKVGGSTGMSGGIIWMPDNPLMRAEGVPDSRDDGLAYLDDVVGDAGQASSRRRRETFLNEGHRMITFLQRKGVRFVRCEGYSDYYPNANGGNARGRSIEGVPFDARHLGRWRDQLWPSLAASHGLAIRTNEMRSVQYFNRSSQAFAIATRVFLRTYLAKLRRQEPLTNGASLVGQLLKSLMDLDRDDCVWTNSAVDDLVVEDGRVVGVRVVRDGIPVHVEARRGVLLAAGGFARNAEMRRRYSGNQPNEASWTIANPGDTGEVLAAAMRLGAQTDLLDEAWWLPSTGRFLGASTVGQARQRPRAILVGSAGQRFCNESNSYVEVGKAMYANKAVPCWLVFDEGYCRRYAPSANPFQRRLPKGAVESGAVRRADTLEALAGQIGVNPAGIVRTVERFNRFAVKGLDPDFGRGQSAYNDCLGDPGYKPNRSLGPIDEPPFYATEIYPGDVGTCGGVVTNEFAQVLDEHDTPIPGLYATGNITATVMGRTYPGAGASIANTMVFGYVAARHAARGSLVHRADIESGVPGGASGSTIPAFKAPASTGIVRPEGGT
jgi:3-oxosteroid 1-dehydrogenase